MVPYQYSVRAANELWVLVIGLKNGDICATPDELNSSKINNNSKTAVTGVLFNMRLFIIWLHSAIFVSSTWQITDPSSQSYKSVFLCVCVCVHPSMWQGPAHSWARLPSVEGTPRSAGLTLLLTGIVLTCDYQVWKIWLNKCCQGYKMHYLKKQRQCRVFNRAHVRASDPEKEGCVTSKLRYNKTVCVKWLPERFFKRSLFVHKSLRK